MSQSLPERIAANSGFWRFIPYLVLSLAVPIATNAQEIVGPSDSVDKTAVSGEKNAVGKNQVKTDLKKTDADPVEAKDLKISFVENEPGIIIVRSGEKTYRVDSANQSVSEIPTLPADAVLTLSPDELPERTDTNSKTALQDEPADEDEYFYEPGDEPFDYRVVSIPTPKMVPKGSWNLSFSHRFSQPIHPISESAEDLLGFDSFSVSSFAVAYGITDKLYVSASRSPLCRRGLCKTIELGAGYHFTDQNDKSPIGITVFGSVEGDMNFSKDYTGNLQVMMSRRLGQRVHLFFSPAIHLYSNANRRFDPRPEDFFPPAQIANTFNQSKHGASFGFGTAIMITPTLLGVFDFVPRTGFKLGRVTATIDQNFNIVGFQNNSEPTIGFGIQKNVGNHSFSLTFTNTQTTTTSRYNSSNLQFSPKKLAIGFNLFRRL